MQALIKELLLKIGEDPEREGLVKTPQRVEKAFAELTKGYLQDPEEILSEALFKSSNSQMVVVKDIGFYSLCEHHLLPFFGCVHVAYIPNGQVVGLSKIARLVEVFARRLQIQEQLSEQIADALFNTIKPLGVGVVISAAHLCMQMRGVSKQGSMTTTSALRGAFLSDPKTREEFFALIA